MSIENHLYSSAAVLVMGVLTAACGDGVPDCPPLAASAAPRPAPAVVAIGCALGLPKGPGSGVSCPRTSPTFEAVVEAAVNRTRGARPSEYPLDSFGYQVSAEQLDDFFKRVVDDINAGGKVCAYRDGLELAVKSTNAFSEQYKFWVTSGHLRLGGNAYRATCTPAWF